MARRTTIRATAETMGIVLRTQTPGPDTEHPLPGTGTPMQARADRAISVEMSAANRGITNLATSTTITTEIITELKTPS